MIDKLLLTFKATRPALRPPRMTNAAFGRNPPVGGHAAKKVARRNHFLFFAALPQV